MPPKTNEDYKELALNKLAQYLPDNHKVEEAYQALDSVVDQIVAEKDKEREEAVAEARRGFVQEIMSLRGKQILAYGSDKLPFVVWEGKADEREKVTIYEQAFKDIVKALTPPTPEHLPATKTNS